MGQFTIKNIPFIHARYGREITCTFGGTEMPEITPPLHTNQRCTMTPMENKMSEIKTETHFGKVYQIDQEYLFGNDGVNLVYGRLKAIRPKSSHQFETHDASIYKYITMLSDCKDQGTITPMPVPLIHGKAYTFDYGDWINAISLYSKNSLCFIALNEDTNTYLASDCTNIRPMAVLITLEGKGEQGD
jgi:hypothetical protein